jgi:hypothetical protein
VAPDAAPEAEAFVALVATGTEDEGETQQVRAYLCDGESVTFTADLASSVAGLFDVNV